MAHLLFLVSSLALAQGNAARLDAKKSLRYSDTLIVTITVEGGETLEVESPETTPTREWAILRQSKGERSQGNLGRWTWKKEIELEPAIPGKLPLPEIEVRYRQMAGQEWTRKRWDGESAEVLGPEGSDIRGQVPVEATPGPSPTSRSRFLEIVGGLTLLLLLLCVFLWRRRPRSTLPLAPEVRALQELERLRAAPAESIHSGVSGVVRGYVEQRFALQAPRQTSEEILQAARASEQFPRPALEALTGLLAACDRVKFTGMAPSRQECEDIVTRGCHFIRETLTAGTG